ncbi:MAG: substrate-binding domain-containing protein, partial [Planctomycetota bacterium]
GVKDIVEVKVGYDGIVLANSRASAPLAVDIKDVFNALAKEVEVDGKVVANPYTMWNEINPSLPATKIEVLGPPPTSGTRDAFVELVMEEACEQFPAIAALEESDEDRFDAVCKSVREDGGYVEAGENDNLIIQKLEANADAYGIFGYSFLDQNADKVQGATVGGKEPTFENIASGDYPVSRSLFFYVKKAHVGVIPGIEEFLAEFTSESAMGEDGYLAEKGLIPMPEDEMAKVREDVKNLNLLSM